MFFSSLCSAIVVKKGDFKHWQDVVLPSSFFTSTIIIIISSFTIEFAYKNYKNKTKFLTLGLLTLALACLFVYLQLNGWAQLKEAGVLLTGNPSGSFIYIVSLFHGAHYSGGIVVLFLLLFRYRKIELNEDQILNFNVLTQYWHYIGLVWVLLYVFFKFLIYN
jgi:cytochrome c oxidase subunit III